MECFYCGETENVATLKIDGVEHTVCEYCLIDGIVKCASSCGNVAWVQNDDNRSIPEDWREWDDGLACPDCVDNPPLSWNEAHPPRPR